MRKWSPCTRSTDHRLRGHLLTGSRQPTRSRGPIESARPVRGTSVRSAVGALSARRRVYSLSGVQPMPPGIALHHRQARLLEGIAALEQAQPHPITRLGSIVE